MQRTSVRLRLEWYQYDERYRYIFSIIEQKWQLKQRALLWIKERYVRYITVDNGIAFLAALSGGLTRDTAVERFGKISLQRSLLCCPSNEQQLKRSEGEEAKQIKALWL